MPHWQLDHAIYSVTIRLGDSLPRNILLDLIEERRRQVAKLSTAAQRAQFDRAFSLRLDSYLDRGYGSCLFNEDKNAEIVAGAFRFFNHVRYELHAWCVMPNHAHAMFYLEFGRELERVLHSWKSYTAHEIGQGVIWEREYFDRIVRSERDYDETRGYILANPSKAGLGGWRWVGTE